MNPLYNLAMMAMPAGIAIGSLRSPKLRLMRRGRRDTMRRCRPGGDLTRLGGCVWLHAASLGEFEQGRPLIERLRRERPGLKILLTFFSPSGYEVRRNYDKVDAVAYLPADRPASVRRFLDAVNPSMAIFVKYEFWGNFLEGLHRRNIPTFIISAIFRDSQPFFKWWGGYARHMLRLFDRLYLQDDDSKRRLASIGVNNTRVCGDTRFDRVTDIMRGRVDMPVIAGFTSGVATTVLFGSSWPADEERYLPWLNSRPDVRAIIAPHEFDSARLTALADRCDGGAVLYSDLESGRARPDGAQVIIIDCFGKLASLYRYGDIAYIGGGFGAGIHNINEAAVYGIPVVFGPNNAKFREASDLKACHGGFEVTDAASAAATLTRLTDAPDERHAAGRAAARYISESIGATDIIFDDLFS